MKKTKKNKSSVPLFDVKFGIYSFLQGCIVLSSFLLVWKLATFKVDTSQVDDFLKSAKTDLRSSIDNTASIVSNLVVLVYTMPQLSSATSVSSFVSFDHGVSSTTNSFIARFVSDFSFFQDHSGVCRFSCSDAAGLFEIGDLWIDGSPIVRIDDKGFSTRLSPWFAKTYRRNRSLPVPSRLSSPSARPSSFVGEDFRAEDYVVKNERGS